MNADTPPAMTSEMLSRTNLPAPSQQVKMQSPKELLEMRAVGSGFAYLNSQIMADMPC